MIPNPNFVTIPNGIELVPQLISDLFIEPRIKAVNWSQITFQTPNMKVGYPGQHLVSLVTGVPGERTGARGNDLIDGSEIKSCSRVDQADKCLDCGNSVLRIESECSDCGSTRIKRNNDSKWLFAITSENDLRVLTQDVKRIVLVLADYPSFVDSIYDDIRFEIFEIWTDSPRCSNFTTLMNNYFFQNALPKIREGKKPAPKNFWPSSYQFYLCNPIKIFSATVSNSLTEPVISIDHYINPVEDRNTYESLLMPINLINRVEFNDLAQNVPIDILRTNLPQNAQSINLNDPIEVLRNCHTLNEATRAYLPLREETTFEIPNYSRRTY